MKPGYFASDDIQRADGRNGAVGLSIRATGLVLCAFFLVLATSFARAETRTLKFYHLHTHERAEIAYKRNGRYIQSGLDKIDHILRDWRENEEVRINPRLLDLIWEVYRETGSRDYINVICGYRNEDTNSMLRKTSGGVAKKSQHMLGNALDFYIPDVKLSKLRRVGLKLQEGGVGYYPRSGSPFVHMDVGNVRHWPRMSRGELLALFPQGKTMHVPADGKRLPGYNVALAAYKERQRDGGSIQMASESGGKSGGLLATLFGGGADEEEDNAEAAAPARGAPARTAVAAAEQPAARADKPELPATVLASLSADSVPVPSAAPRSDVTPRPEVAVGESLPEKALVPVVASAQRPVSAPRDETPATDDAPTVVAAANVPKPTWRPDYSPPATPTERPVTVAAADRPLRSRKDDTMPSTLSAMASQSSETEASDAIAGILAREENQDLAPASEAAPMPLPAERPSFRQASLVLDEIPHPLAASMTVDASNSTDMDDMESTFGVPTRRATPVSDTPRLALLNEKAGRAPVEVISGGVSTTGKSAKPNASDMRPRPKPVVLPVNAAGATDRVLSRKRLKTEQADTTPPAFDSRMMRSPQTVYTDGFHPDGQANPDQHFTGQAVTFLAVARFAVN